MSLSRILATVAAIAGIAVIAVVLYLLFADLGQYRPTVEQAVTEATGRQFTHYRQARPDRDRRRVSDRNGLC